MREREAVQVLRKAGVDYVNDLVRRAKRDYLGLSDEERNYLNALSREIYDIEKLRIHIKEKPVRE